MQLYLATMWRRLSTRLSCLKIVCTSIVHRTKMKQSSCNNFFWDALGIIRKSFLSKKKLTENGLLSIESDDDWGAASTMFFYHLNGLGYDVTWHPEIANNKSNQKEVTWHLFNPTNQKIKNQLNNQPNKQTVIQTAKVGGISRGATGLGI